MNTMIETILENTIFNALEELQKRIDETDFIAIADNVLNRAEETFKEGGLADRVAEKITAAVRERFGIEDSNPDN